VTRLFKWNISTGQTAHCISRTIQTSQVVYTESRKPRVTTKCRKMTKCSYIMLICLH